MKRVARFKGYEKPACVMLNDWLRNNPEAELLYIHVYEPRDSIETIHAIIDMPEKPKSTERSETK